MASILIVDDEPELSQILALLLTERGHRTALAASGPTAIEQAAASPPDVAIVDVSLPGMSGIEAFTAMRARQPALIGIFITAFGTIQSAVDAMRAGGFDYLTKPFDNEQLVRVVERALELRHLSEEVGRLTAELNARSEFPGIVGRSEAMQAVLRVLPRVAETDATVLLLGESGTGKELIARNLHRHSKRASGPFVPVNCSAIPAGLVEAEFFGHEPGAFTDAKDVRIGRFEQAHGGTLFLDEVGELSLEAQAKLLRVLEDRSVTRLGGRRPRTVDVRLIAATHRNLRDAVAQGRFREDFYWRLHVMPLALPALRDRASDVALLTDYFVDRLNGELGRSFAGVSGDARRWLAAQAWPGNVRELENVLRRAMILAEGPILQVADFHSSVGLAAEASVPTTLAEIVAQATSRIEREVITATLVQCRGNRTATADALGINRRTLFTKMRQYGMVDQLPDEDDAPVKNRP